MVIETKKELLERNQDLKARLDEAEQTLRALRSGEVDAIVVSGPDGDQVYTLRGADEAYRVMVENMAEGAVTLTPDGLILFSNEQFASLLGLPLEGVIGFFIRDFVAADDAFVLSAVLSTSARAETQLRLKKGSGGLVPAHLSTNRLWLDGIECVCLMVTDLTEQKRNQEIAADERLARSILDQAAGALLVVDPTGKIIRASRAAEQLAQKTVLLHPFDEVFRLRIKSDAIADAAAIDYTFTEIFEMVQRHGRIADLEAVALLAGGRKLDVVVSAGVLTGAHSECHGCIVLISDVSGLRRAEQALRESEERYRTLFDLGPIAAYSCDASGVIREFNRRAAELWGRKPKPGDTDERWCGSFKLLRPDGSLLVHEQCPMAEVLSGAIPEAHDREVQIERPDGSRITVSVNIFPLKNERGEITGAINCFVDITDRKRNDEILRESEQKYHTLFDSIDEGFCIIEKVDGEPSDFRYIEANPAFASQAGASGVVGKTIRQAFPGEPEEWFNIYDTILRTGEPKRFERYLVTHGRTLELFAFRVEDKVHRRVAVIFRDITSRKEGERAGSLLAAIVDSSDDAIISKNLDGVITSWNKSAERLFGYPAEEAIGQNITLIVPPDRLQEEVKILDSLKRAKSLDHIETKRIRKDGTLLDISATISPVKDSSGRVVGASKVARDITERKMAEKALQEAHRHLELMVEQRTASVRQLSLRLLTVQDEEHRHIARELHDSVVQDLAMIKVSVDRLPQLKSRNKQAEVLAQLSESLDKCLGEIRTISYLLHPPQIDELGFSAAAQWYIKGFSERSGIKAVVELSNESKRLPRSVELPLFRILQASLSNVHRHAHSPSVDVRFAVTGEEAQLEVKDYGNGIDPEVLARFNRNGVGAGIGLTGMRERLREMGGRLEIESDANGTLIRAVIPVSASTETKRSENAV